MNKSDSERLAGYLEEQKYRPVNDFKQANLVIVNICSVREAAVNRAKTRAKQIKSQNPKTKLVLTGCIMEADKKEFKKIADEIWPHPSLELKAKHAFKENAFVPIMTGCNNFCSYCVVPYARGKEKSRKPEKIIKDVENLIEKGHRKIMLLGQNVNSYNSRFKIYDLRFKNKKKCNFPSLLKLATETPGDFKISFLTSHPKDMSDKLIEVISSSNKISKDIHLPVQSGDNEILKKMNRKYTVEHYKNLINKIKERITGARISTDIIVGFPGETKNQFENTVKLIKEVGFSQIFVAAYSPRPQTAASKLEDDISCEEKKRRREKILNLVNSNK
jgi:tRNA-2-methylthio-N6-dimethylallyladenosine synthase